MEVEVWKSFFDNKSSCYQKVIGSHVVLPVFLLIVGQLMQCAAEVSLMLLCYHDTYANIEALLSG